MTDSKLADALRILRAKPSGYSPPEFEALELLHDALAERVAKPPAPGEVELPPLPDRFDSVSVDDFTGQRLSVYTASQMEAYARAAIAKATGEP